MEMTLAERGHSEEGFNGTPTGDLITTDEIAAGYEILLRRKVDEAGLRHWQSRSAGGLTLLQFMIELLRSDEFQVLKRAESRQPHLAARPAASEGPRTLVVRGDINSGTGYSRAIELYTGKLAQFFERVVGVDLHFHPSKHVSRWPHETVDDGEIIALLHDSGRRSLVLNVTTPDRFTRFSGTRNVGLFFWESSRIHIPAWRILSVYMDEIWAPTRFQLKALTDARFFGQLRHVPCPFPAPMTEQENSNETELLFREIGSPEKSPRGLIYPLRKIRSDFAFVVLTIGTFLPRKGFPVLAHDWVNFAKANPDAALLIKTSSIDVSERRDDLFDEVADMFRNPARRMGVERTRVFINTATIPDAQVDAAISACDAYVTCSYGEGFGLGLFESLGKGKPVACPRNSAFGELLPSDYPYFMDCDQDSVGLPDRVGLQSISSTWGIPKEGSVVAALEKLRSTTQKADFEAKLGAIADQVQTTTTFNFSQLFDQ